MLKLTELHFVHLCLMADALLRTTAFLRACFCKDPLMSSSK